MVPQAHRRFSRAAREVHDKQVDERAGQSGDPGGCGIPSVTAAVMSSPLSWKVTSGAAVYAYRAKSSRKRTQETVTIGTRALDDRSASMSRQ